MFMQGHTASSKGIATFRDGQVRMVQSSEWPSSVCATKDCPTVAHVKKTLHVGKARAMRKWTNGKAVLCDACAEAAGWIVEPLNPDGTGSNTYLIAEAYR